MATTPDDGYKRLDVRLPRALYESLAATAARQRRSVNAQIVVYIERGVAASERAHAAPVDNREREDSRR